MAVDELVTNQLSQINAQALQASDQQGQAAQQGINAAVQTGSQNASQPAMNQKSNLAFGQSTGGSMPQPDPGLVRNLQALGKMHEVRKQVAVQKLGEVDKQMQAGFFIDPKHIAKLYKQAGLKLDTSPEGIQTAEAFFKGYQGQADPLTGVKSQVPKEIQDIQQKIQSGKASKKDLGRFVAGAAVRSEMRSARWSRANELQKAQFQQQAQQWIETATGDGSPRERGEALGKLSLALPDTYGKLAIDQKTFALMTPEQKQLAVGKAAGEETQQDKDTRSDKLYDSYVQTGMNADAARKMADATANHKEPPAGVQLPAITKTNLGMALDTVKQGAELGVSGADLGNYMNTALKSGVDAALQTLPKGFQTIAQKNVQLKGAELGIEQEKVGVERQKVAVESARVGVEAQRAKTEAAVAGSTITKNYAEAQKIGIELKTQEDKSVYEALHLVSALKDQKALTQPLETQLLNGIAQANGMKVDKVYSWFGKMSYQYTPESPDTDASIQAEKGTQQQGAQPQQQGAQQNPNQQAIQGILQNQQLMGGGAPNAR